MSDFRMDKNRPVNNSGKAIAIVTKSPANNDSFGKITVVREDYDEFKEEIKNLERNIEDIE